MLEKLSRHVASICAAEDSAQIDAALALAVRDLNFVSYNLTCGKQSTQDFMTDPDLTSWTTPDLEAYDRDRWGHRDPLLQRLAGPGRAHFWRGTDWLGTPHHDYSEYVLAVGIGGGITIPLASSPGRFSAMTLLTPTPGISSDQMAAAQILANVAQSRLALTGRCMQARSPRRRRCARLATGRRKSCTGRPWASRMPKSPSSWDRPSVASIIISAKSPANWG